MTGRSSSPATTPSDAAMTSLGPATPTGSHPQASADGALASERAAEEAVGETPSCCPFYHEAVELIGRRWTGAIVAVLIQGDRPLRFSEIAQAVPELSDRLLSERMKELESRGVVERLVAAGPPARVTYQLTPMGRSLEPAVSEIKAWAQQWLAVVAANEATGSRPSA